jgi:hypothetical protein
VHIELFAQVFDGDGKRLGTKLVLFPLSEKRGISVNEVILKGEHYLAACNMQVGARSGILVLQARCEGAEVKPREHLVQPIFTPYVDLRCGMGALNSGEFVLAWHDQETGTILLQPFSGLDSPRTTPTPVSTTARGVRSLPGCIVSPGGHTTIVWAGAGEGDADGIYARRYSPARVKP